jgi:hypothetical protein
MAHSLASEDVGEGSDRKNSTEGGWDEDRTAASVGGNERGEQADTPSYMLRSAKNVLKTGFLIFQSI